MISMIETFGTLDCDVGIGAATALRMAADGWTVVAVDRGWTS